MSTFPTQISAKMVFHITQEIDGDNSDGSYKVIMDSKGMHVDLYLLYYQPLDSEKAYVISGFVGNEYDEVKKFLKYTARYFLRKFSKHIACYSYATYFDNVQDMIIKDYHLPTESEMEKLVLMGQLQ